MAEGKSKLPLLGGELTVQEQAHLAQLKLLPCYPVLVKLLNAACLRATQDTIRLDPETEDYERKVTERTRRARCWTEFSDLIFSSIDYHEGVFKVGKEEEAEQKAAEDTPENIFGIHPANPSESSDAIRKTFGIHPAKPKKEK